MHVSCQEIAGLIFGDYEPSTSPLIRPKIVALVQGQNVALWGAGPWILIHFVDDFHLSK